MSIKRSLTNAGRKLFPAATAVYDELINAQDTYNNMYGYDKYKVRENVSKMYNQLEGKNLATNKELADFIPTNSNPLKNVDKYVTEQDLINQQIKLLEGEATAQKEGQAVRNAQRYIDSYWKANEGANENLWNRNMDTLKDLGVSMDNIRAEYYRRNPTPQMQAWDEAGKMLDDYIYRILDGTSKDVDTDKREAKKIFVENLAGMINDGQIEYNIDRIKRFVDAYDSIFQNNRNISGPRRGVKTPSSAGQRKFIK